MKQKNTGNAQTPRGISTKNYSRTSGAAFGADGQATPKKPRFLFWFICIFLSALIIFGAVFGIILGVRNSRAVAKGGGVYISEGVANYFASRYKVIYLGILNENNVSGVSDTEIFWSKTAEDGKTYGELLSAGFKSYLSEIIAGNILYDSFASLSGTDERVIENTIAAVVRDRAGGTVESFNERAAVYGFNYDDFCEAVELQYKYDMARSVIYGSDGTRLDASLANEFLGRYTHVSLAFIRTDYGRRYDTSKGEYVYYQLSGDELAKRLSKIEEYCGYIDNIKDGSGEIMTGQTFHEIENDYEGDEDVEFYFYEGSSETKIFAADYPEVVEKSYTLKDGEFAYVECDIPATDGSRGFKGVCFIYKTPTEGTPYKDEENTFFSDFYSLASKYYYATNIVEYSKDAEFTELYDEVINPTRIPKNNEICIMAWVG